MQKIRTATFEDLDAIAAVEAACFPAAEAATKEEFAGRLTHYADHFWLLFEDEKLVSFVDGFVTDTPDLTDEMYADASPVSYTHLDVYKRQSQRMGRSARPLATALSLPHATMPLEASTWQTVAPAAAQASVCLLYTSRCV